MGAMTGHNPTDRSELGRTKRHILTDKNGIPLSVVISSANTHDIKLATDLLMMQSSTDYQVKLKKNRKKRKKQTSIFILIKHIIPSLNNKS